MFLVIFLTIGLGILSVPIFLVWAIGVIMLWSDLRERLSKNKSPKFCTVTKQSRGHRRAPEIQDASEGKQIQDSHSRDVKRRTGAVTSDAGDILSKVSGAPILPGKQIENGARDDFELLA